MDYIAVTFVGIIIGSIINLTGDYFENKVTFNISQSIKSILKEYKYICIELVTAVIIVVLYSRYSLTYPLFSYSILMIFLMIACIEDIKSKTISNRLVLISLVLGAIMIFVNPNINYIQAVLGMIAAFASLWFISFITKGDLGMGDVKLFASVGLYLGLEKVMQAIFYSAVLSGAIGIILIIISISNKKKTMPFVPFMLVGTLLALLL